MNGARIDHMALWARDLDALCAFYARYFGAAVGPLYQNPGKGFSSRFLSFSAGARIEVMSTTSLALVDHALGAQRLGLTHLAISVGSEAAVDALTEELHAAGQPILDGPRRTGDGYYESVVLDPEGNRIEITV
jgi:lactoylglutathione lyase